MQLQLRLQQQLNMRTMQLSLMFAGRHPLGKRCHFDVYATSITLKRRHVDVKTTLCA